MVDDQPAVEPEVIPADQTGKGSELSLPGSVLPTTLHILPIAHHPFLPVQALPVQMSEDHWLATVEEIGEEAHHMVGLVMVETADQNKAGPEDFVEIGSVVRMHHPMKEDGTIQFIAEGVQRFRIVKWLTRKPPFKVQVEYPMPPEEDAKELKAYGNAIIGMIKDLLPLNPLYGEELKTHLERFSPSDPSPLADFGAILTSATSEELLDILRTIPLTRRMEKVLHLLKQELEVGRLQTRIRSRVEEKMTEQQRQFFLREQLKEIQKELGISKDDRTAELEKFTDRLKDLTVPENTMKTIQEEMDKLSVLETGSPEYAVTRNYLDWLTSIPWGKHSKDKLNLTHARRVLNEQHEGLSDVKDRIIEFIGVGAMKGEVSGSIILLVGPLVLVRPQLVNQSLMRWVVNFIVSAWVACGMKQKSRGIAGRILVPCQVNLCRQLRMQALLIQSLCWMKLIRLVLLFRVIRPPLCWKHWTLNKIVSFWTIIWMNA